MQTQLQIPVTWPTKVYNPRRETSDLAPMYVDGRAHGTIIAFVGVGSANHDEQTFNADVLAVVMLESGQLASKFVRELTVVSLEPLL